jgi:hypothetical protein
MDARVFDSKESLAPGGGARLEECMSSDQMGQRQRFPNAHVSPWYSKMGGKLAEKKERANTPSSGWMPST